MQIFELLAQYEGICRRAFFGCSAKLNKTFKANIIEILILIMCIPRKINFLQLGRYGRRGEQRYRQTFSKDFDWMCFNMNLAADRFQYGMKRLAIAIDPSYVSKAGKKTAHIGRFWSGCASAVKHGLEILGIAVVDADIEDAMMLRAVQTQNATELKAKSMTLGQWDSSPFHSPKKSLTAISAASARLRAATSGRMASSSGIPAGVAARTEANPASSSA